LPGFREVELHLKDKEKAHEVLCTFYRNLYANQVSNSTGQFPNGQKFDFNASNLSLFFCFV